MTGEQVKIVTILIAAMIMFIWGRWRHDVVAAGALLACVFAGLVPEMEAFRGFSHPAVITVACVLLLSYGLQSTGAVDFLVRKVIPASGGPVAGIAAITVLAAVLSAFINNVGAMALMMPLAFQVAARRNIPPGKILMPLAFASILGGTITLIGTPPNIIVSGFRAEAGMSGFTMFDFTPVGLGVAGAGILFIVLAGWRFVPARKRSDMGSFDTGAYITEVRIPADSKAVGKTLREVEKILEEADAQVIGMVRNDFRVAAPNPRRLLKEEDILIVEAEPESLSSVLSGLGLKLEEEGAHPSSDGEKNEKDAEKTGQKKKAGVSGENDEKNLPSEVEISEMVVLPTSRMIGRSASDIQLRTRYAINLLAVSRQGYRSIKRLRSAKIKAGDVLLMQGGREALSEFSFEFGCAPLAKRPIGIPNKKKAVTAALIMALSVAFSASGLLSAAVSFAFGAVSMVLLRVVPLNSIYEQVNWPVIVLLGAMFPVAGAMETTGAADLAARFLFERVGQGNPVILLIVIMAVTMTLSDFMNNAATAAIMCPVALSMALQLGVNPDAFLMAVAVGASCAFLTPIGHQNNTLVLGPGGFRFGDYWRLGLPVEIIVVAVSVPVIMRVWPL